MKGCSSKVLIFTIALLTGWAAVASFEGYSSFQSADALKASGKGGHYCSFETADKDQTQVDQRLLESLGRLRVKELDRMVKFGDITAKRAAEIRSEANGANKVSHEYRTIAVIEAVCRREGLSSFQCDVKKGVAAFDIEKNVLPVCDSFPDAASFDEWQLKRRMEKQTAETLFDENAGLDRM